MLEVDNEGLDALDHRYLDCIAKNYDGGPVGIETLAAALSEPRDALEEIVEPYLLQQGFIGRTPRGRVLTLRAYRHLGLTGPSRASSPQIGLFDEPRTTIRRPRHAAARLADVDRPPCRCRICSARQSRMRPIGRDGNVLDRRAERAQGASPRSASATAGFGGYAVGVEPWRLNVTRYRSRRPLAAGPRLRLAVIADCTPAIPGCRPIACGQIVAARPTALGSRRRPAARRLRRRLPLQPAGRHRRR